MHPGISGLEHVPVDGSQVPASWHWSRAVQALPSSHVVASASAGFEQAPVVESQVPAAWHWSEAVQTTASAPMQEPPWQVSVRVQRLPSLQVEPFGLAGLEQAPVVGSQVPAAWHWSEAEQTTGFAPTQEPPWQVSVRVQGLPSLQVVPFGL